MLTAQRFRLSVRAEGEAERWPPISLNTWSPPIPCLPPFLSLSPSLSISSSSFIFLPAHRRPGKGADSSLRPSLSKRACYSPPSLWDRRKSTHTQICTPAPSQNWLSQKHTPTHCLFTHKYCFTVQKILAHTKTLTALG